MKIISDLFSKSGFVYGLFAIAAVAVMVFAVLPQFPQTQSSISSIGTAAVSVFAFGESGDGGCCGGSGPSGDGPAGGSDGHDGPGAGPKNPGGAAKKAECALFTASPTHLPHGGGNVRLQWMTVNAVAAAITPDIARVNPSGSMNVHVTDTKTYTLSAYLMAGMVTDTCQVTITVDGPPPAPPAPQPQPEPQPQAQPAKCDYFNVSRATVPHGGGNVTLSWGTSNANWVSITNIGQDRVYFDDTHTLFVSQPTTFTLTAGGSVNDTCQVRVEVAPPPAQPVAKCDYLRADKTKVAHGGEYVTLSWETTNATDIQITPNVHSVPLDGSRAVHVTQPTTFTLTAIGAGGNDTCQVFVDVDGPPPAQPVAKCDYLRADKTKVAHGGEYVTLSWETTNATDIQITPNVHSVPLDGSRAVHVTQPTTFTLTAIGAGGNDTCQVSITVGDKPAEKAPRCDFFTVSDDDVDEGDYVTLDWGTTNADSVFISNGVGNVSDDGSERVRINDDTTFVLTARGTSGQEDTCSVRVEVDEDDDDDDNLRCELDISDKRVRVGEEVTLEWETRDAEEMEIEDNHGNRIYRDRSLSRRDDGKVDVVITEDTRFTMTAENDDDEERCRVEVEVEDGDVLVLSERNQPRVAGISLTQVPYTGFEAGPMLAFLFYALLTAWALFAAYMLVIRKDSFMGFSLAGARAYTSSSFAAPVAGSADYESADTTASETYTASTAAAVAPAPVNLPTATPITGYTNYTAPVAAEVSADDATELENYAHAHRVLISSDALRQFRAEQGDDNSTEAFAAIVRAAKATFPTEDGWVVLNLARYTELAKASA